MVLKPDNSTAGVFALAECQAPFLGRYYFDFLTNLTDPEGEYFAMIVSPTENYQTTQRISLYVEESSGGGGPLIGIPDLIGLVDPGVQLIGILAESEPMIATVNSNVVIMGSLINDDEIIGTAFNDGEIIGIVGDVNT